jgi:hypothetical protein
MRFHLSCLIFILGKFSTSFGQTNVFSELGHPDELALLALEPVEPFAEEQLRPLEDYNTESVPGPNPLEATSDELDLWLLDAIEPTSDALTFTDINTQDAGKLFGLDNTGTPQNVVDASDECPFNDDPKLPGKLRVRGGEKCGGDGSSPPVSLRPDFSYPFSPGTPLSDDPLDFPYINSASEEDRKVFQRKWCPKGADDLVSLPVCSSGNSEDVKLSLFLGKVNLENCALCKSDDRISPRA